MTAIQIFALISIAAAAGILCWIGYRGGLADGRKEGYEKGHDEGYGHGLEQALTEYDQYITQANQRREHLELLLGRQPQDQLTLLSIAEKLKLAAVTFKAVKSETHAAQTLALREKVLSMAAAMHPVEQGDAA